MKTKRESKRQRCPYSSRRNELIPKLDTLTIKDLLKLGRIGAGTDYAVRFYRRKKHPKFYWNRAALLHAIRRALQSTFADTIERMCRYIDEAKPSKTKTKVIQA